jgi:hypothetical protein
VTESGLAARLPGATFTRFCPWAPDPAPPPGSGAGPVSAIRPLWVDPAGNWPGTGAFDAVVAVGGVFAGPPFVNFLMQAFTLGARPELFDPRPVVAWHGVGLDDSVATAGRPEWSAYLRALAGRLDLATVRAPSAAQRFSAAGAPVPHIVPDPAFALPAAPRRAAARSRPRIGVAVGEAAPSQRFLDTFAGAAFIARSLRSGGFDRAMCLGPAEIAARELARQQVDRKRDYSRVLGEELAGLQRVGTVEFIAIDNVYDDAAAAEAFAGELGDAPVRHLADADAAEVTVAFGDYDLLVVSRLHSVILALRAGVPFVAADPYFHPAAGTSKVHQLLGGLGLTARHWRCGPAQAQAGGASLSELAVSALADAPEVAGCYAVAHERALAAIGTLAAAIGAGRAR